MIQSVSSEEVYMWPKREDRDWTIPEFLKIPDRGLQVWIYNKGRISSEYVVKVIDNEEKLGFYAVEEQVRMNSKFTFYKHSTLSEWAVYNKKTKKAKVKIMGSNLRNKFLEHFFNYPGVVRKFVPRISPTFVKMVVEGKIKTLRDVMKYHVSYTVRDKKVLPETALKFMLYDKLSWIGLLEDPNSVDMEQLLEGIVRMGRKLKTEEISEQHRLYEEWDKEQNQKYDTLYGKGNERIGLTISADDAQF